MAKTSEKMSGSNFGLYGLSPADRIEIHSEIVSLETENEGYLDRVLRLEEQAHKAMLWAKATLPEHQQRALGALLGQSIS